MRQCHACGVRGQREESTVSSETHWRKSQRSGNGECVEVWFDATGLVWVRDSKDPDGPRLSFDPRAWEGFLADVRVGSFDPPAA